MTVGSLVREWRSRRRLSQLELSTRLGVSSRHVSFVETGRGRASRELLLRLAEELDLPLRARNELLLAAGYAPTFGEHSLDDVKMTPVRSALDAVLTGHDPYPAIAVDECWNLVAANRGSLLLLDGIASDLLTPPLNVMRLCLHPRGLAPRVVNLAGLHSALLRRIGRQADLTGRPELADLHAELSSYAPDTRGDTASHEDGLLFVPLRLRPRHGGGRDSVLNLLSTITTFGTPLDATVAGLSMESFFPADPTTADLLRAEATASDAFLQRLAAQHPHLTDFLTGGGAPEGPTRRPE